MTDTLKQLVEEQAKIKAQIVALTTIECGSTKFKESEYSERCWVRITPFLKRKNIKPGWAEEHPVYVIETDNIAEAIECLGVLIEDLAELYTKLAGDEDGKWRFE